MLANHWPFCHAAWAALLITGCSPGLVTDEDKSETVIAKAKQEAAAKPKYSDAAIVQAAVEGKMSVVKQALEDGNALTAVNFEGFSALHTAAFGGHLEIVKLLLDHKAELMQRSEGGKAMTALHTAAFNGHTDVVRFLLEQGIPVDDRDAEGKSALIHAASGPFPKTVQLLLDQGADVNLADTTEEFTALMMAAAEGHLDVVKLLISKGADPMMADEDDDTAISFAMQRRQTKVVQFLSDLQRKEAAPALKEQDESNTNENPASEPAENPASESKGEPAAEAEAETAKQPD